MAVYRGEQKRNSYATCFVFIFFHFLLFFLSVFNHLITVSSFQSPFTLSVRFMCLPSFHDFVDQLSLSVYGYITLVHVVYNCSYA